MPARLPQRIDDPSIEALGMLIEAHAEVTTALERDLGEACDLPTAFLGVLIRLARTPGEQMRMTQLAGEMTITTSGLTRLVDRMEDAGLVERQRCPGDRRGLLAVLTDAGRARLDEVFPVHLAQVQRRLVDSLDDDELATLTDLLRRVRDGARGADS